MEIFRAVVWSCETWWELRLLDLSIMVDGETEDEMLRQLQHSLCVHYTWAVRNGLTPFMKLKRTPTETECAKWKGSGVSLRRLDLPEEVRVALSMAIGNPKIVTNVQLQAEEAKAA